MNNRPTILIDTKKWLIRIHKHTLYMLGSPEYIELLVNPKTMRVAIRVSPMKTNFTHKINWDRLFGKNSYEITCKYFITKLAGICGTAEAIRSCKLAGEYSSAENIVSFELSEAFKKAGDEL